MRLYFERKLNLEKTEAIIRVIIIEAGKKARVSTGLKVKSEDWSVEKGRPVQKQATETINVVLNKYVSAFDEYYNKIKLANETPSINAAKDYVERAVKTGKTEKASSGVASTIAEFIASKPVNIRSGRTMRAGSLKPYNTLANHLNDFKTGLQFVDINKEFAHKFALFLSSKSKHVKEAKDLQIPTLNKMIVTLKALCKWAYEKRITSSLEWHHLKTIRENNQTIVSLHQSELAQLAAFDFGKAKNLEQARDLFIFGANCGLRYEDLFQVNKHTARDGYISLTTEKTLEPVRIPITGKVAEILAKYDGTLAGPLDISNQKLNQNIKRAVKLAGIDRKVEVIQQYYGQDKVKKIVMYVHEAISIHDSRKSYISIGLQNGMTPREIMKMSAQKSMRTLDAYANLEQSKIDEKMLNIFNKL